MTVPEHDRNGDGIEPSAWSTDEIPAATAPVVWDRAFSTEPTPATPVASGSARSPIRPRWKGWLAVAGAALVAALAVVMLSPTTTTGELAPDGDGIDVGSGALDGVGDRREVVRPVTTSIGFPVDPIAEIGIDLVTVGRIGAMTHLDLDGRAATRWDAPDLVADLNPQLFADATRVFAVSGNGRRAFVSEFGRATELEIDAALLPPFLPGPREGTVWTRSSEASLDVESLLIDLDGASVDSWVRLAVDGAVLLGADGSGGLLLSTGGDVYTSAGGEPSGFTTGLNRLTTGEVLAVGEDHAIVRECDVSKRCTTSRLDRETRELTRLGGFPFTGVEAATGDRDVSLIGSVSPDGGVALLRLDDAISDGGPATQMWTLFDIDSGVATSVEAPSQGQPMIWNDDSSYAVFASQDALFVYERSTATIIEVEGGDDVRGLTEVDEGFSGALVGSGEG